MNEPSRDRFVIEALRGGRLRVDFDTGDVYHDGALTSAAMTNGYLTSALGSRNRAYTHRIVWIAAHGPIAAGMQVNHRNRRRDDNRLVNLELVTAAENIAHGRGSVYYNRIRPEDEAAVDGEWLAQVMTLAASGEVTREQVAALLPVAAVPGDVRRDPVYGPRPETRYTGRRQT